MQLKKQVWKRSRNSARYTAPMPGAGNYRTRKGGRITVEQKAQQIQSRRLNPQDPFSAIPAEVFA